MIISRDRILTTHVGSLPRNEALSDLLMAQEEGKSFDRSTLAAEIDKAVRHVVDKSENRSQSVVLLDEGVLGDRSVEVICRRIDRLLGLDGLQRLQRFLVHAAVGQPTGEAESRIGADVGVLFFVLQESRHFLGSHGR